MESGVNSFRDLIIWKRGLEIVKMTYEITKRFPKSETFGLASQMQRAAVSIPSNIAEGHIRSRTKEFLQFLRIALSSCAELETQAIIANDIGYLSTDQLDLFIDTVETEAKQIRSLSNKLTKS
jgi:four helix bundle protein